MMPYGMLLMTIAYVRWMKREVPTRVSKVERGIPPVAHLTLPDQATVLVVLSATTQPALAVLPGADCRVCDGTTISYGRSRPDELQQSQSSFLFFMPIKSLPPRLPINQGKFMHLYVRVHALSPAY